MMKSNKFDWEIKLKSTYFFVCIFSWNLLQQTDCVVIVLNIYNNYIILPEFYGCEFPKPAESGMPE